MVQITPLCIQYCTVLYREGVFLGVGDDCPGCFLGGLDPVRRSRFGRESKIGPFWPSGCVLAVLWDLGRGREPILQFYRKLDLRRGLKNPPKTPILDTSTP